MKISVGILDFNRPKEAELLLHSLKKNLKCPAEIVYISNGGEQDYVIDFYKNGMIDKLVLNSKNHGCGIGMRQIFESCSNDWVICVQVDQWLAHEITEMTAQSMVTILETNDKLFHFDLSGNQGHGAYSERAHLVNRKKYLAIEGIDKIVGGPGPYADQQWTENYVQEHMFKNGLTFAVAQPTFFADNGKVSIRDYPCGGRLALNTDDKKLFILKPLSKRTDFPNLLLTDAEWEKILKNEWVNGDIPEQYKDSSFTAWNEPYGVNILS